MEMSLLICLIALIVISSMKAVGNSFQCPLASAAAAVKNQGGSQFAGITLWVGNAGEYAANLASMHDCCVRIRSDLGFPSGAGHGIGTGCSGSGSSGTMACVCNLF